VFRITIRWSRQQKILQAAKIPICTLNYDTLLERITGLPTITVNETEKMVKWMRREAAGILHRHGSWEIPSSCVLGIRDYQKTLDNDVQNLIQQSLASFKRLLFIGCGDTFADPNFSALIRWLRNNLKAAALEHYALVTAGEGLRLQRVMLAERRATQGLGDVRLRIPIERAPHHLVYIVIAPFRIREESGIGTGLQSAEEVRLIERPRIDHFALLCHALGDIPIVTVYCAFVLSVISE
jgi:hypothetical protein